MSTARWASLLAFVAGSLAVLAGVLTLLAEKEGGTAEILWYAGTAVALVALAAMGHELVASAPIWLRIVVVLCFPLLVATVWLLVADGIDSFADGWHADLINELLLGAVLVIGGLFGWRRAAAPERQPAQPHHRH